MRVSLGFPDNSYLYAREPAFKQSPDQVIDAWRGHRISMRQANNAGVHL
jgi:hypothetical protein